MSKNISVLDEFENVELILLAVICSDKILSHACLTTYLYNMNSIQNVQKRSQNVTLMM